MRGGEAEPVVARLVDVQGHGTLGDGVVDATRQIQLIAEALDDLESSRIVQG